MNFNKRIENVGKAINTLKNFAKAEGSSEGTKAMINTVAKRLRDDIGHENFDAALKEMDYDNWDEITKA